MILMEELHDALKEANVSEEKAKAAARAVAAHDEVLKTIQAKLSSVESLQWVLTYVAGAVSYLIFR
jgi:hypothetical protein